jgi:hypothetical protein
MLHLPPGFGKQEKLRCGALSRNGAARLISSDFHRK